MSFKYKKYSNKMSKDLRTRKRTRRTNIFTWVNKLAKTVPCWLVEDKKRVFCYVSESNSIYGSETTTFNKIKDTLDKLICIKLGNFSLHISTESIKKIEKDLL